MDWTSIFILGPACETALCVLLGDLPRSEEGVPRLLLTCDEAPDWPAGPIAIPGLDMDRERIEMFSRLLPVARRHSTHMAVPHDDAFALCPELPDMLPPGRGVWNTPERENAIVVKRLVKKMKEAIHAMREHCTYSLYQVFESCLEHTFIDPNREREAASYDDEWERDPVADRLFVEHQLWPPFPGQGHPHRGPHRESTREYLAGPWGELLEEQGQQPGAVRPWTASCNPIYPPAVDVTRDPALRRRLGFAISERRRLATLDIDEWREARRDAFIRYMGAYHHAISTYGRYPDPADHGLPPWPHGELQSLFRVEYHEYMLGKHK
ncbi:MAG: hypothetical protein LBS56_09445 [Propionibacteriaceae bacterium]|nr:hypothetical protein [Propionibacteriaceae bacterium]